MKGREKDVSTGVFMGRRLLRTPGTPCGDTHQGFYHGEEEAGMFTPHSYSRGCPKDISLPPLDKPEKTLRGDFHGTLGGKLSPRWDGGAGIVDTPPVVPATTRKPPIGNVISD